MSLGDYLFEQLNPVQSNQMPTPPTVASDTTISITHRLTFISGTVAVAHINPPIEAYHELILIYTDSPSTMLTSGNIAQAIVPTQNLPTFLFYNPTEQKYYGCASNLT